jgi:ATP-dependent DNA helicase RecQ
MIVVSPLISLMKDQVDELTRRRIPAAALHSLLAADRRRDVVHKARRGELRLLYVAPERFASDSFMDLLHELRVSRFVIDEAHCVSEWGHEFRPDYRRLRGAAAACRRGDGAPGRPPMAAFTATATAEVRADIVGLLGLADPEVHVTGFDRPNIHLSVEAVADEDEKHRRLPTLVGGRRALVYAATRRTAEAGTATLEAAGLRAATYHAGLDDTQRTRVQDRFATGAIDIVCATNAFGMGIDRPDVEVVVHLAIPGSVEAYYQEIGRAGRDGRDAQAILFWDRADVSLREYLIDSPRPAPPGRRRVDVDPAEILRRKDIEHQKLRRMVAYAEGASCLRATILRYFGDRAARESCGGCSRCMGVGRLDPHEREVVRKVLSGIVHAGERYGRRRVTAMLRGETADLPASLARLAMAGALRFEPHEVIGAWIDASIAGGLVAVSNDRYRTLSLTPAGREVMTGRAAASLDSPLLSARMRERCRRGFPSGDRFRLSTRRMRGYDGGPARWRMNGDVLMDEEIEPERTG